MLARDAGIEAENSDQRIKRLKNTLKNEKDNLKRIRDSTERQKKNRFEKKLKLQEVLEHNPDIAQKLKVREKVGRPRIEGDQLDLLKVSSAIFGSCFM